MVDDNAGGRVFPIVCNVVKHHHNDAMKRNRDGASINQHAEDDRGNTYTNILYIFIRK